MCTATHFNNSWHLQSIWCKSVVRSDRSFSKFVESIWWFFDKLRRRRICGKYFGLIDSFLSDRLQRVLPIVWGYSSKFWWTGKKFVPKWNHLKSSPHDSAFWLRNLQGGGKCEKTPKRRQLKDAVLYLENGCWYAIDGWFMFVSELRLSHKWHQMCIKMLYFLSWESFMTQRYYCPRFVCNLPVSLENLIIRM